MEINNRIQALILLGANMGDVKKTFIHAINELKRISDICKQSSLYSSPSWGFEAPDFLNQAVIIETALTPQELMDKLLNIEKEFGRTREGEGYQSRTIDMDIILIKEMVINTEKLLVPHPKMQERKFVLVPCNEIASAWQHPLFKKTISELLEMCEDSSNPKLYE